MEKRIGCLLIANRGEIAIRIIRTCRKMGIRSAVVYSSADAEMPFVREADIAVLLEGNQLADTYLSMDKIIDAAQLVRADAIHPAYGFLSENAFFAQRVIDEGFIWVGPNPNAIAQMGLKANAKEIAVSANVPVVPGYSGAQQEADFLYNKGLEIGFPLLLKASAGGGGKGMRIVHESAFLKDAIGAAAREAEKSFGNPALLIERYFPSARHIEIQILGDKHGNLIHLFERECSLQRRYQKIAEESPSPALSHELRNKIAESALSLCRKIGYDNAGTVEFIYTENEGFYFLEVNTRLQVEHPVTEAVSGIDLVEWQISIAEGEKLNLKQQELIQNGYSLECRLYAENPLNNFLPATGKIFDWFAPEEQGIRIDAAIENGSEIGIMYDPMIAKIICHDRDRYLAIRKMAYYLRKLRCQGLQSNQLFLIKLMENQHFIKGDYDTHFISDKFPIEQELFISQRQKFESALAVLLFRIHQRGQNKDFPQIPSGWRNNYYQDQKESFFAAGEAIEIHYRQLSDNEFLVKSDLESYQLKLNAVVANEIRFVLNNCQQTFYLAETAENVYFVHHPEVASVEIQLAERYPSRKQEKVKGGYESPMPGEILKILVSTGQKVEEGTPLMILVSMKMENTVSAAAPGTVTEIFVSEGELVPAAKLLLRLEVNSETTAQNAD
jgi:acetyl/propionyl-CoA carboxylase alpha subunit